MSDGFKRVPSIFNAEIGKTPLDAPKKKKEPFKSKLGKSSQVLNDTVKYSAEVAKRSLSGSMSTVQKAVSYAPLKYGRKKSIKTDESDDSIEKKVERLFDTQDLLFERLDSEPKLSVAMKKSIATIKHTGKSSARYVHKQPLMAKVVTIAFISLLAGGLSYIGGSPASEQEPATVNEVAGATTPESTPQEEPKESTKPTFSVVTPSGKEISNGAERETPSKDKIYSYPDRIGDTRIEVTQQELPATFSSDSDTKLAEFAKATYLANVIQIDEDLVYHGMNEKSNIQTFVFIRGGNLVFIKADQKIEDDLAAAYILSLE